VPTVWKSWKSTEPPGTLGAYLGQYRNSLTFWKEICIILWYTFGAVMTLNILNVIAGIMILRNSQKVWKCYYTSVESIHVPKCNDSGRISVSKKTICLVFFYCFQLCHQQIIERCQPNVQNQCTNFHSKRKHKIQCLPQTKEHHWLKTSFWLCVNYVYRVLFGYVLIISPEFAEIKKKWRTLRSYKQTCKTVTWCSYSFCSVQLQNSM
jgi:hypothetical protein